MAELQRLSTLAPDWNWSACAVIAREWKYLEPVRAWCEVHGVPVQMGNEEIPSFWHLRETRALLDWLRERGTGVVNAAELREWLAGQGLDPDRLRGRPAPICCATSRSTPRTVSPTVRRSLLTEPAGTRRARPPSR